MKLPSGLTNGQLLTATREGGIVNQAYWDPMGKCWTAGIGCTGSEITEGIILTDDEATQKFIEKYSYAENGARNDIRPIVWDTLSDVRKAALTDIAYQQGVAGLLEYHHMIIAVQDGDWPTAKAQCIASKADKQTPGRCEENAEMLLTNDWPSWLELSNT